ncbi:MAG: hypothetical protein JWM41_319 [Gemmatimonadetes bacterium]|nr:hypothetical protein [Gemmatimonadota bacterium]
MSASSKVQTFSNHARYVPGFHFVTGALTLVIAVWTLYRAATLRTPDSLLGALVGVALVAQFWYLRAFPLAVQNRVIRLEERLRLEALLPSELQSRRDAFTPEQLIALRFASDAELPVLAKKVLDEQITERAAIKALVVNWRPDHMRA